MKKGKRAVGDRIEHPEHGLGTVTFVGTEYVGVAFDDTREILIRLASLERNLEPEDEPDPETGVIPAWPASTFFPVDPNTLHYMGSHWDPFVDDVVEIMKSLPEILPKSLLQIGYGDNRTPPRSIPQDWPRGHHLVWPLRTEGLALLLLSSNATAGTQLASVFPFTTKGLQIRLTLHQVHVWQSGLEAQITAGWGESVVSFFDSQYLLNRGWYEADEDYDFILSGIAYDAGPAKQRIMTVNHHPDEIAWMNQRSRDGVPPMAEIGAVHLGNAAIFLPIDEWDIDDYHFRAPVKEVTEFRDWLGQDGWRVRATVMRFEGEDADLDILVTRRAWSAPDPPQVGQDIEGRLWLQGYLWMPA